MRRPVSNITGKPTIPVPGRLDLAVLQQIADNVRERLRQLDSETTYLRSIADNGTSADTIITKFLIIPIPTRIGSRLT